jgi:2-polyprenyl-6-methoxyphenol hydroxylase-like FAD-dependent oxidoreductase
MMCGYLLARAGIGVTVLEKHADFLRDFRGDTIHPSTLQVMHELGLLEEFLTLPHQEYARLQAQLGEETFELADFSRLPTRCRFVAFMPQWDFLNFLAQKARTFPNFRLLMESEAIGLLREGEAIAGVHVRDHAGERDIHARLTIAAEGRHSRLRDAAGFEVRTLGAPMDVLWFKLAPRPNEAPAAFGRITGDGMLVRFFRGDYWQCALIIRKGSFEAIQAQGIEPFRARVARLAARDSADEIASWDDVRLLTVAVDRLPRWHRPGLLFIGDAAHAMSPIGGVGINLAIQDAVATANRLAEPLRRGTLSDADLAAVEARRRFPTWATQKLQTTMQTLVIDPVLDSRATPRPPAILKLAQRVSLLRRIPARVIGMGFRPEHVRTADGQRGGGLS